MICLILFKKCIPPKTSASHKKTLESKQMTQSSSCSEVLDKMPNLSEVEEQGSLSIFWHVSQGNKYLDFFLKELFIK